MGPALAVALLGLVLALVDRTHADRVLAAFVLVYFATLLPLDAHFDRYVLPLVPALGALAGRVRALAPVTLLLLVIPLVW
jgi:drug/metabolite transporter superfamily protein YnfA